jgi:hypothetical protein
MIIFGKRNRIKGHFEGVAEGSARGWVYLPTQPNHPLTVEILDGERVVAVGLADQFRQDMLDHGFGDGCHAFCIPIDHALVKSPTLWAREARTGKVLQPPIRQQSTAAEETLQTRSSSILQHADSLIQSGDHDAALALLKENLCAFPDDKSIADKLLDLLQQGPVPSHLPGAKQWITCEKSRLLLEIVITETEKQIQSRGSL